ncbi:hypothetical protein D9M70_620510 [compost metagenome]
MLGQKRQGIAGGLQRSYACLQGFQVASGDGLNFVVGPSPIPPQRQQGANLFHREPQVARMVNTAQDLEVVVAVDPIARRCAA